MSCAVAELSAFFLAEHNEQCPDGTSPTDFIMFLIQVYQFSDPDKLSAMADKWATYQSQKLRPLIDSTRQRAAEAGHRSASQQTRHTKPRQPADDCESSRWIVDSSGSD